MNIEITLLPDCEMTVNAIVAEVASIVGDCEVLLVSDEDQSVMVIGIDNMELDECIEILEESFKVEIFDDNDDHKERYRSTIYDL